VGGEGGVERDRWRLIGWQQARRERLKRSPARPPAASRGPKRALLTSHCSWFTNVWRRSRTRRAASRFFIRLPLAAVVVVVVGGVNCMLLALFHANWQKCIITQGLPGWHDVRHRSPPCLPTPAPDRRTPVLPMPTHLISCFSSSSAGGGEPLSSSDSGAEAWVGPLHLFLARFEADCDMVRTRDTIVVDCARY